MRLCFTGNDLGYLPDRVRMEPLGGKKSGERACHRLALTLTAALCAPAVARAAHPLITDDAGTLGGGVRQLEITSAVSRDSEGSGAERVSDDTGEGGVGIGYGLLDRLDVLLGIAASWSRVQQQNGPISETHGIGDLAVELKWRAFETGGFALALKPRSTLPTGDPHRGLGTGRACFGLTLIASQDLGPVALHANVSYLRDRYARREDRDASRLDRFHASLAATFQVAEHLRLVADLGAETPPDRASSTPAYVVGGSVFAASNDVDLDVGLKAGLSAPEPDIAGLLGATYRF